MRCKWLLFLLVLAWGAFAAAPASAQAETPRDRVLLVYSSKATDVPRDVWQLDSLLSHFDASIRIVRDEAVDEKMLAESDWLVYYATDRATVPPALVQGSVAFQGRLALIGQNAEQFPAYQSGALHRVEQVPSFHLQRLGGETALPNVTNVYSPSRLQPGDRTLLQGKKGGRAFPAIIQNDRVFYAGASSLLNGFQYFLADALHEFFQSDHKEQHIGYLRLEDISPASDPKKVKQAGQYLIDRHIPFLLAVIPVYVNPKTAEKLLLADQTELVEVLRYLQAHGGSVVAHGYAHTYRSTETGEGFEFWDVEHNQPIVADSSEADPATLQTPEAFASEEAYESYMAPYRKKEGAYIDQKLRASVEALTDLGLPPLAFEAPHYTMSHEGYAQTASYFSSLFGQVQLSGRAWESMGTPPYIAKPSLLHGMTLYPETIGYVDTSLPMPIEQMKAHLPALLAVRDSMIGGFYHPYLGMRYLPALVDMMESIDRFEWLDLKRRENRVQMAGIRIESSASKGVQVQSDRSPASQAFRRFLPDTFTERALYVLSLIVFLFVVLFAFYTLYLRSLRKKQLFKER